MIAARIQCEECRRHTDYDLQVSLLGLVVALPPDGPAPGSVVIDGRLILPVGWAAVALPRDEPARWAFFCADHAELAAQER